MDAVINSLANLTPSIASTIIFAYLYLNLVKQQEKTEERREKKEMDLEARREEKDKAFLEALGKLTAASETNREMIQQIAGTLSDTAKVNAGINSTILEELGGLKCIKLFKQPK